VGKTTCAAAMAVRAAQAGHLTLVISTDPAPSLGDALDQPLGPAPRPVRRVRGLHAVEVDARRALDAWVSGRRDTLEAIALRGSWLDREDVGRLLKLSLPGIDEVAALLQIAELGASGKYERVVVDTAPTGHLLRMMEMPGVLQGLAVVFDHMQAKHRLMVEALRGGWTPDAADVLIARIGEEADAMRALLRDGTRTRLTWVTLPEMMAVDETADGVGWLTRHGVVVDTIVVNRLTDRPPQPCRWCQARRREERNAVAALVRRAGSGRRLVPIPAAPREPRGPAALSSIGAAIERPRPLSTRASGESRSRLRSALPDLSTRATVPELVPAATRLVMFGGKGGVGKTTCAAAVAVSVAHRTGPRPVVLLSADPAHSLGDVFGQAFSDVPARVRGGPSRLVVRELDAARALARLRDRLSGAVEELFTRLTGAGSLEGSVVAHDRRVMRDLMDLSPPGIDELVAMIEVLTTLDRDGGAADGGALLIVDTAPTGHALRLIEMPELVHDWVKALMAILLKYQPVVGVGELGAVLLGLSQGLGRLRALLADSARTRFIAVTRAAALPRAETLRLLKRLRAAGVSVPLVVVNAAGGGTCSRCRSEASVQIQEIDALRAAVRRGRTGPEFVIAPGELPPPHGPRALREWRAAWVSPADARPRARRARSPR
jgi:arsenite-transporting ATPase